MTVAGEKKVEEAKQTVEVAGEKTVKQAKQTVEEERARLGRAASKLMLASIGAVALGKDTLERWLDRLAERGEQVQATARKQADAFRKKQRQLIGSRRQKVEDVLDSANLPSKTDIQSLHDQIAALSTKVDQLSEEKVKRMT